jgi:MSHA biogenesis protein MshG
VPFFAYKGRNARGELMQGVLEGVDSGAIADQLFGTGVTPSRSCRPRARPPAPDGGGAATACGQRLTRKEGHLDRRPAVQPPDLHAAEVRRADHARPGRPAGVGHQQELRAVIKDLRESLDAGRELSAAMRRHPEVFNQSFYLSMVRVGEMTGRLEEVFLRLFDHLEFDRDMRERVKTALRYPTFVIIAMVAAMVVVNMFVIPQFEKVFKPASTPSCR